MQNGRARITSAVCADLYEIILQIEKRATKLPRFALRNACQAEQCGVEGKANSIQFQLFPSCEQLWLMKQKRIRAELVWFARFIRLQASSAGCERRLRNTCGKRGASRGELRPATSATAVQFAVVRCLLASFALVACWNWNRSFRELHFPAENWNTICAKLRQSLAKNEEAKAESKEQSVCK